MKYLCKDCWKAHEPATLLARCAECDLRTEISRPDPLLSKAAGGGFLSGGSSELVCRIHKTQPLELFCDTCKRPVPPRAIVGDRSVIAILGDTASGKTSLLWIVTDRLREGNGAGISIRQPIGKSDEQLFEALAEIFERGRPRPTAVSDADTRNYAWELTMPAGSSGHWVIAFHDAAGEAWRDLAGIEPSDRPRLLRYLDLIGSVVFAIDGQRVLEGLDVRARGGIASPQLRFADSHELTIADALARRFRARGVPMPVAVTVTKADLLWDRDEWKLFRAGSGATAEEIDAAVRELFRRSGRQVLLDTLESSFAPLSFFAVSAFGCDPSAELRIEDLRPARVEEPLLALLGVSR